MTHPLKRVAAILMAIIMTASAAVVFRHHPAAPAPSATTGRKLGSVHAPSAQVQVNSTSLAGWHRTDQGAVPVVAGETVSVKLTDTSGAVVWVLSQAGKDDQVVFPTLTQAGTVSGTATFVAPASPGTGWSLLIRSQVGAPSLGHDVNGAVVPSATYQFIVYLPTAGASRVLASNETTEGDPSGAGWAGPLNTIIRAGGISGSPTGAAAGDWKDNFPAGTNIKINGQRVPWKSTARVAATSNITLSGTQTIDGVGAVAGDRVLVTNQTTPATNGLYTVSGGSWVRASDFSASADSLAGSRVFVSEGTSWANTDWALGNPGTINLGSTALTFTPDRVQTVAALRTVSGKTAGQRVRLLSYQTLGDRGDSDVYWDASSTSADDGCLVFAPTGVSTGRWKRLFAQSLPVTWCGAGHGSASQDTAAIQGIFNLFSNGSVANNSTRILFPSLPGGGNYLINATLTLQGALQSSLLLEGEAQPGIGTAEAVTLFWAGASNYAGAILEAVGTKGLTLKNIVFNGQGKTKYLLWLHPDHVNVYGSSHTTLDNCVLRYPANMSGAGALILGDTSADTAVSQTDVIRLWSTDIEGNAINGAPLDGGMPDYSAYLADGIVNLHGGNTKNVWLYGSAINYFRYAFNLTQSSGPVVMYGGSASGITGAILYGTAINFIGHGIDAEGINAVVRTVGSGAPFGNISLYQGEFLLQPYTLNNHNPADGYDIGIDWWNGHLVIDGGTFANYRFPVVTAATNATPIVITATGHQLKTGDKVSIFNVAGNTAANGWRKVTVVDSSHFSLQDPTTGANIAGSGAYTSGGLVEPEFKIRLANQDPASSGGIQVASSAEIHNAYFQGSHGRPHVEDTNGNDLLSRAFVSSVSFPVQVEAIHNTEVQAGTGTGIPMTDAYATSPALLAAHTGVLSVDSSGAVSGTGDINITSASIPGVGAYNLVAASKEASQDYLDFGDNVHTARSYVRAATGGLASMTVGTTDVVRAQEAQVSVGVTPLAFVDGFDPVISQNAVSGDSLSGHTLIIRGQSMFGNSDIGSNVSIRPGSITGSSPTLGYVQITDGSNVEKLRVGGAGLSFYTATPVAQASRAGQLTNSAGGTPGSSCTAVDANCVASLIAKINALDTIIHNVGLSN